MSITSAPCNRVDRRDDLVPVFLPGGVDDDVAQAVTAFGLDEVHRPDHAAGLADRARDETEDALRVLELDADGQTILGAWRCAHGVVLLGSFGGRGC